MNPQSRTTWGLCESQQRPALVDLAASLHNGSMLHFNPCDLYQLIKGRTLWLIGWVDVVDLHIRGTTICLSAVGSSTDVVKLCVFTASCLA